MILSLAMGADDSLPDDVITLKAMLRTERAARFPTIYRVNALFIRHRQSARAVAIADCARSART